MEIPDETEIGWYQYGATAGQPGATVLAAHVSWNRTQGPFARLGSVNPGERIEVALDDGTVRLYEVTERTVYGKSELPRERIWRNTGEETLVLITCGGDYNPEIRRYRENIVVYAVPVGRADDAAILQLLRGRQADRTGAMLCGCLLPTQLSTTPSRHSTRRTRRSLRTTLSTIGRRRCGSSGISSPGASSTQHADRGSTSRNSSPGAPRCSAAMRRRR
jgi:LPXTG-site transpeptidase (sortase) family protein